MLPWPAKRVLAQACFWLVRVRLALAHRSFAAVLQRVRRWAEAERAPDTTVAGWGSVRTMCHLVERAARGLPGRYTCLPQALAGYVICARRGRRTVLRVGVNRASADNGEELTAHAWLELEDGTVVLGDIPRLRDFRVFDRAEELIL